jgi:hypothetical protein
MSIFAALENEKWEKIIARDKRAAGGDNTENNGRIVIGLYGKVMELLSRPLSAAISLPRCRVFLDFFGVRALLPCFS